MSGIVRFSKCLGRIPKLTSKKMTLFPSAKNNLSGVKNYQPGKPLEELEREYGIKNAVKMASNENALGPSPKALAALRRALPRVHRYPDGGCFYLRRKLAAFLKVEPARLVFGNGSDELLVMAVRTLVGSGDEVIIADPTFLIYEIACQVENGAVVKVPMTDYRYDLDAMRKKIGPKTKLIFIANPDNPVGTYIKEKSLTRFLSAVPKNVVVVLDEAYYEFAKDAPGYPDSIKLLETYENLVVTRTFSKAYGLSGLRVGYGLMSVSLAETFNKVREPFNVNLLAQEAAIAALEDKAHLKKSVSLVQEGRRYLVGELSKMGVSTVDTVTNFILADLKTDAKAVYEALLKKGVIIRPMTAWGLHQFIRVTIGRREENKRFIGALKQILK